MTLVVLLVAERNDALLLKYGTSNGDTAMAKDGTEVSSAIAVSPAIRWKDTDISNFFVSLS